MGDPAGVGPEILLSLLDRPEVYDVCHPVVVGSRTVLNLRAELLKRTNPCRSIQDPTERPPHSGCAGLIDLENIRPEAYTLGKVSADAGRASVEYLLAAIDFALGGQVDAIVTGPINKEAIHLGGYRYAGHTEILAEKTRAPEYGMMLMGGPIRVVLVTTHLSLRQVPQALSRGAILQKIRLAHRAMQDLGFVSPRIAVAGLNPHAGEAGLFGDEEQRLIAPAVEQARQAGLSVSGPLPPDTVFHQAYHGAYEVVVCMYHDQGLIPLKMIAFDRGVNVTLGLPIIRTSVDHGTAYDLAGSGKARDRSLYEALLVAVQLVEQRKKRPG
jgi:4-hydroxythreonine-4-phosphate dehydrogenase